MKRNGLRTMLLWTAIAAGCLLPETTEGQSLRGSGASVQRQYQQALDHDFTFLPDPADVMRFVELKLLVPLEGNRDYRLDDEVSFGYARPATKLFVERLSSQYRRACGEQLVVTSVTRPKSRQPRNSSRWSVHPTGMALDLRRSNNRACRAWLERVLMELEGSGALEATKESRPPHYHIAVFPNHYERYVAAIEAKNRARATQMALVGDPVPEAPRPLRYKVQNGDALWSIARAHGTTVDRLKSVNNLRSTRIYPGQFLEVPVSAR